MNAVIVHAGLLRFAAQSGALGRDILAGTFAHELGHLFHRHPGYGSHQGRLAAIWDELRGITRLDRAQEREADVQGIQLACAAGFDPHGMLALLAQYQRSGTNASSSFMQTHPRHKSAPVTCNWRRRAAPSAWLCRLRTFVVGLRSNNSPSVLFRGCGCPMKCAYCLKIDASLSSYYCVNANDLRRSARRRRNQHKACRDPRSRLHGRPPRYNSGGVLQSRARSSLRDHSAFQK